MWMWIVSPLVGAAIGLFTNWLALKLLFWPRRPIWGFQGIIPKQKEAVIDALAKKVDELLSPDDLARLLREAEVRDRIQQALMAYISAQVEARRFPPAIQGLLVSVLQAAAGSAIMGGALDNLVEQLNEWVKRDVRLSKLAKEKLSAMDIGELERLAFEVSGNQLRWIVWLGGILGAVICLIQPAVAWLAG